MAASASRTPNRLSKEKSPYLLQHQYNPVDWYVSSDFLLQMAQPAFHGWWNVRISVLRVEVEASMAFYSLLCDLIFLNP